MNTLAQFTPENAEQIVRGGDVLSSELTDEERVRFLEGRIDVGKAFWNNTFKLDQVQEQNEKYWLNNTLDESRMYLWNVRYKDNRIFQSIETILPQVLAQIPQPIVTAAHDTDASKELARNIEQALEAHYYSLDIEFHLGMMVRHILAGMRYAVGKYRFDPNSGVIRPDGVPAGRFVFEYVNPRQVVFDAKARRGHLKFLAEYVNATGEELIERFPDKKDEIYNEILGSKLRLNDIVTYPEMWFEYIKDGKRKCEVAWKYGTVWLGGMKNPYFDYETPENNYFDEPRFPYVFMNYLSMGRYIVDDTSLTEQAMNMQDIVNKRGRQIVENADAANTGKIFNRKMVNPDDASKVLGNVNEALMVDGNASEAFARVTPPILPDYVLADKLDARNEIDNIFGTHAPLKGEGSTAPTLGQEVISQNQDKTRIQTIAKAVERTAKEVYEGITQMMCVFWTEPTQVAYTGVDGKSIHMEFDTSKIEPGVKIVIKGGSSLPKDKITNFNLAMKLAPLLDPLTLAEKMDEPNPKEVAKRIVYWKFAADRYVTEILGENAASNMDHQALEDVKAIVAGSPVTPPENPTQSYIGTLNTFITSPAFEALDPISRQQIKSFAEQVLENGRRGLMIQTQQNDTGQLQQGTPQGGEGAEASPQMGPPEAPTNEGVAPGIGATQGFGG